MDLLLRRRMLIDRLSAASDPYLLQPFTITFNTATTFGIYTSMSGISDDDNPLSSLHIRINDGEWQQGVYDEYYMAWLFNGNDTVNVSIGDVLQIKGVGAWSNNAGDYFTMSFGSNSARCVLSGNINSLVHGDNFVTATTMPDYALNHAFYDSNYYFSSGCSDVSGLRLPATTVGKYAYSYMFTGSSITSAPELPATELGERCYDAMFYNCRSLTVAPKLPATVLKSFCYSAMFNGCTSLATPPNLPAMEVAESCYQTMFYGCSSLTAAPALPATTLFKDCYRQMFRGCSKLTQAPVLPATTLVSSCYWQMFYGCSSLNYIKAMFTTTPASSYTSNWVKGVASSGTFVKNSAASWNVTGNAGVPSGWTVQTANS